MRADRRFVLLGLATSFIPVPPASAKPCATTRVLFVCQMGTVNSAIAREELRQAVKARGLPVEVQSRGLTPADHVTPEMARRLKQDGINPKADPLRRFSPADAADADITIAFDDAAKAPGLEHARAWHSPSWTDDYDHAKRTMDGHIAGLTAELAKRPCVK